MTSMFGQLVMRTDEARRGFEAHPKLLDAVANGMSVQRYRALLLELYHVVWHFNPVSAAAASRMLDSLRQVRYFLYEHMHEETGHEVWVQNDLHAIGVPVEVTVAHMPSEHTLALTGYNYWAAERRHPASVLGMLYTLEVVATVYGGPFAAAMRESLLLEGERGISFIASHAMLDAKHMARLREIVNLLDSTASLEAVVESAGVNFHHLTRIVEAV
jgi:pyrroloquinoline quinone (PQQ) biosynthesis protein C